MGNSKPPGEGEYFLVDVLMLSEWNDGFWNYEFTNSGIEDQSIP